MSYVYPSNKPAHTAGALRLAGEECPRHIEPHSVAGVQRMWKPQKKLLLAWRSPVTLLVLSGVIM